ncbi:site-specific DNA-methyltransferase, partial [uncultured Helicobacter sp.]
MLNHNDKSALQAQGINIIDSTDSKEHFEEQFKAFLQHNAKEVLKENHIDLKALSYFLGIDENLANMQGYELTFTGKGLANALYNTPCQKELKHKETFYDSSNTNACHSEGAKATEESQKETSHLTQNDKSNLAQNSIIIGDNLDALKILKSAYSQKIKMIYIDPPYNTGKDDFIYPDDFRADYKEILKEVGLLEINENGEAIESQTLKFFKSITSSRSHSGWLSFMLPRLKLARDLLKDDGVIFISIDDNEQANLKLLCDEIFGEENFVACLMWRKIEENASSGGTMKQTKTFRKDHEYILCYAKTQGEFLTKKYMELPNFEGNYKNLDNDPRGAFKAGSISMKGNKKSAKYYEVTTPSGKKYARVWRITKDEFDELDKDNRIYYGKKQDSVPQIKIFLNEERPVTPKTIFENLGSAYEASENLKKMFQIPIDNEPIFDSPKPVELIKRILEVSTSPNPANNALDSAGGGG